MALNAALLALALFAQDAPVQTAPSEPSTPAGAPSDDFGLVAWCHGSLTRWMELRDRSLPEVRRIEGLITRPGSSLEEDMRAYDELHVQAQNDLALFTRALRGSEAVSRRPLDESRTAAMTKGRAVWTGADELPAARLAQEWMSWTLPARCQQAAARLQQRAERTRPSLRDAAVEPYPVPGA